MSTDDEFARDLRARADAAAPAIDVDLTGVVPRARRRRAWTRAAGAGAAGGLVLAGVLVGQAWAGAPWSTHTLAGPAGPGVTAAPSGGATTAPPTEPTARDEATADPALRDGTAQGAAPYWYTLITGPGGTGERSESWLSPDRPGLLVWDGDLANATAAGPSGGIGRFRIGGAWVDALRDPAALPTDPAALEQVLRDSVEPDRLSGTDDDKVYGMAYDLLNSNAGWLPTGLLQAAWEVAGSLPGSTVVPGEDSSGRVGEVLTRPGAVNGPERLVVDPATGLVLELNAGADTRVLTQAPADELPLDPARAMAGCVTRETC